MAERTAGSVPTSKPKILSRVARGIAVSVIRTLILAALAGALATVSVAAAILALTASSALLLAWVYRKPWPVGWLTALGPFLAATLTLVAQTAIPLPDLAAYLLPAAALGAVAGVVLAFFHRLEQKDDRWMARPAIPLILLWGLGLLVGQGTTLSGEVALANYGVAAAAFTSALLSVFFLSLLIRRLSKRALPHPATTAILLLLVLAVHAPAQDRGDAVGPAADRWVRAEGEMLRRPEDHRCTDKENRVIFVAETLEGTVSGKIFLKYVCEENRPLTARGAELYDAGYRFSFVRIEIPLEGRYDPSSGRLAGTVSPMRRGQMAQVAACRDTRGIDCLSHADSREVLGSSNLPLFDAVHSLGDYLAGKTWEATLREGRIRGGFDGELDFALRVTETVQTPRRPETASPLTDSAPDRVPDLLDFQAPHGTVVHRVYVREGAEDAGVIVGLSLLLASLIGSIGMALAQGAAAAAGGAGAPAAAAPTGGSKPVEPETGDSPVASGMPVEDKGPPAESDPQDMNRPPPLLRTQGLVTLSGDAARNWLRNRGFIDDNDKFTREYTEWTNRLYRDQPVDQLRLVAYNPPDELTPGEPAPDGTFLPSRAKLDIIVRADSIPRAPDASEPAPPKVEVIERAVVPPMAEPGPAPEDERERGDEDERERGDEDERERGPEDERERGPEDERERVDEDERERGDEDERERGPEDERERGDEDEREPEPEDEPEPVRRDPCIHHVNRLAEIQSRGEALVAVGRGIEDEMRELRAEIEAMSVVGGTTYVVDFISTALTGVATIVGGPLASRPAGFVQSVVAESVKSYVHNLYRKDPSNFWINLASAEAATALAELIGEEVKEMAMAQGFEHVVETSVAHELASSISSRVSGFLEVIHGSFSLGRDTHQCYRNRRMLRERYNNRRLWRNITKDRVNDERITRELAQAALDDCRARHGGGVV